MADAAEASSSGRMAEGRRHGRCWWPGSAAGPPTRAPATGPLVCLARLQPGSRAGAATSATVAVAAPLGAHLQPPYEQLLHDLLAAELPPAHDPYLQQWQQQHHHHHYHDHNNHQPHVIQPPSMQPPTGGYSSIHRHLQRRRTTSAAGAAPAAPTPAGPQRTARTRTVSHALWLSLLALTLLAAHLPMGLASYLTKTPFPFDPGCYQNQESSPYYATMYSYKEDVANQTSTMCLQVRTAWREAPALREEVACSGPCTCIPWPVCACNHFASSAAT